MFLHFFIFQTNNSNVWIERMFQACAQKLFDIRLDQIPLYFSIHFSSNNLTFTHINCCAIVQSLNDLNDHEHFWFGKKCESAPDKLQCAVNNFTVTYRSQMKVITVIFLQNIFHQYIVRSVARDKLQCQERSTSDVRGNNIRPSRNKIMNDWTNICNWNWYFSFSNCLCSQWTAFILFHQIYCKMIKATLRLKRPVISQALCTFETHL
jgi:hypothetical protein